MSPAPRSARLVAVLLLAVGGCSAQQISFRNYGTAEGLENLTILSLAQDGAGYIWAGSEAGLYRYDGTRFRLTGPAQGLPCTKEVQALYVARDGALWANTCSGLFRFDGSRFHAAAGVSEMLGRSQALAEDAQGRLVVATRSGLEEIVPGSDANSFAAKPYLPSEAAARGKTLGILSHGSQLWFGCATRLCVAGNGHVTIFGARQGLPESSWDAIAITPDKTLWVRSANKLYRLPAGAQEFAAQDVPVASSAYWGALTSLPDGTLLVPNDEGVAEYRDGHWSAIGESRGLPYSIATSAIADRQGSLWIGLVGGGVVRRLGAGEWEGWTRSEGLASNLIWNILRARSGALWVGTDKGLTRLVGTVARTWTSKDGLIGNNVRWLGETRDGAIWSITNPGGLARIDPGRDTVQPFRKSDGLASDVLHRGLIDHAGRLWVAGNAGVFRNDAPATSRKFVKVDPPGALRAGAWALAEDGRGQIWLTGPDGLWSIDNGRWQHYTKADGLLSDDPYLMVIARDNTLWLRHRFDAGVERVEYSGTRILRSTMIVPSNPESPEVTAFHGFDSLGNFWRGTAAGVSVLRAGLWTRFTTEDGLIWNDCDGEAFWADPDGSVWIGTSRGLSHFSPRPEALAARIADPILSALEIQSRPRMARISFSTLSFLDEQAARFSYRLDGGPWSDSPEHTVSLGGLGPGHHRVEVRCRVRDGPFSPKLAAADFYLEPMWWETWWFRCLLLLQISLLAALLVMWRHRNLRTRNASLERAVFERTAELERERVKVLDEKRRADDASQAKGQFLAHMSHEIRTPLNGLIGLSYLIEDARDPEELRKTVRLIRSSGQTLLRVINDILDFSKVESGKLELEIAPFAFIPALEESAGLFRPLAAEKGLRLTLAAPPDLPGWVAGDETRLRQILQNLISNALKFTDSGEIRLSAALEETGPEGHRIRIAVSDTGIGIAPDRIASLFSPFTQADTSITRRFGGTGLGLTICQQLVGLMGGEIAVESKPGAGTTFHFTVRFAKAEPPGPTPVASAARPAAHLRVLLAEDNPVNQIVTLKLLAKLGVSAELASDGAAAIEAVEKAPFDVVLMDVEMPHMDGIAATQEIRKRLDPSRQPYICGLTAHATKEFHESCLKSGMNSFLTKPLDFEKLRSLLAALAG